MVVLFGCVLLVIVDVTCFVLGLAIGYLMVVCLSNLI